MFKITKKNLIVSAIPVVLLIFLIFNLIPTLRNPLLNAFKYPLTFSTLVEREINGIIFYHRNIIQNENFRKQNDFLKQKILTMEELRLENRRLEKLLSLTEKAPFTVIAARVIGHSPDNWASMIIIDKGRNNGIRKSMVVINYLGLVGRVIETAESVSKVILINDPNFSVSAINERSRQEGLVSGTLGDTLIMRYLPKEADIKPQDIILTSGLTPLFPKSLLIGRVVDVGEEFSGLARYAIIKPAVDTSMLEEVLLIAQ